MDQVLREFEFVCCYIDDVVILSATMEDRGDHLGLMFAAIKEYELRVNVSK